MNPAVPTTEPVDTAAPSIFGVPVDLGLLAIVEQSMAHMAEYDIWYATLSEEEKRAENVHRLTCPVSFFCYGFRLPPDFMALAIEACASMEKHKAWYATLSDDDKKIEDARILQSRVNFILHGPGGD